MDLRGFGWTDIAWEGFEKENMADDVANVMAALEIDRASIVGHDWGGWIGYLLALRRPELVERLVALLDSAAVPDAAASAGFAASAASRYQAALASPARPSAHAPPGLCRAQGQALGAQPRACAQRRQRLYGRDLRASTRARAAMLLYRTYLLARARAGPRAAATASERLTVPTLVLHGDRDPIVPPVLFQGHERYADDMTDRAGPSAPGTCSPRSARSWSPSALLEFFAPEAG